MTAQKTQTGSATETLRTFFGWFPANATLVLTLIGAAVYAIVRLSYDLFYGYFGLSPDDVGLGYGEAVARAAGFAAYFVALFAVSAVVWTFILYRIRVLVIAQIVTLLVAFTAGAI